MSGQSQTKLMKLVFKQATLTREPYRNAPWTTCKMNQTNKDQSSVRKYKKPSRSNNTIKKIVLNGSSSTEKNKSLSKEVNHLKAIMDSPMGEETMKSI
ncbi:unnamed protein product [Adineta steineri]|uniref:Uncharacterized protein n=1 Tax=Adineta steineri TaxID=433720 RepID=A0A818R112_9BILA|nr:unnamed protein product [Adineta steineri]CAF3650124.1 unnamed protein product [Adineta steineri]